MNVSRVMHKGIWTTALSMTVGCVLLLPFSVSPLLHAQEKDNSPVFKKYRPPPEPPLVEQSDPIYQIWQTFILTRKANAGDVLAQHELGIRYLLGRGADADTVKAAYWIHRAALQKYVPAVFNYAIVCYYGWGVPWDPFEAYRSFLYCAEQNMVEAQYAMAQFLTEDLVVPRDYDAAYGWVKKAAEAGYAPAKEAVQRFERHGIGAAHADSVPNVPARTANTGLVFLDFTPDTLAVASDSLLLKEAIQSASPTLRKALGMTKMLDEEPAADSITIAAIRQASEAGSPEALTVLGRLYERGIGLPKNIIRACACYIRAVRVNSPRAAELLWNLIQEKGMLQQIKNGAGKGEAEAEFAWAGISALGFDGVLAQAQVYLAGDQAFHLLEQSALKKYVPAMVEMGLAYYAGRWVAQNTEKAMDVWSQAAALGSKDAMVRIALTLLRTTSDTSGRREAVAVLRKAAEDGSVLAEVGLGYCYETGTGTPKENAEAAHYYRAASVRGSQDAFRALRRMHDQLRPEGKDYQMVD